MDPLLVGPLLGAICAGAALVGFVAGGAGVGGVLLVPLFTFVGGLPVHRAAASANFAGMLMSIGGLLLLSRTRALQYRIAIPLAIGGALGAYPGARVGALLDPRVLAVAIGALVMLAGLWALRTPGVLRTVAHADDSVPIVFIGALAGFAAGLSGAGGPVVAMPVMLALGYPPLALIGVGQPLVILASGSATIANVRAGLVDYAVALATVPFLIGGFAIGVRFARRVDPSRLRRGVALLCIAIGCAMPFVRH